MTWIADAINITIALVLVALNGFFVAAEFALVKVRLSQIEQLVKAKKPFAKTARWLAQLFKETMDVPVVSGEPEDEDTSRWSHTLWNAISADDSGVDPEVYAANLELGDSILLCTDGLTKYLDKSRLIEVLSSDESTEAICQRMIDEANNAGGNDNITVVVSRFCDATDKIAEDASRVKLPLQQGKPDPLAETGIFDHDKIAAK